MRERIEVIPIRANEVLNYTIWNGIRTPFFYVMNHEIITEELHFYIFFNTIFFKFYYKLQKILILYFF